MRLGLAPPIHLHLPASCHSVSSVSEITASEIEDDRRFRRLSCIWRSSLRFRRIDRSRLLWYRASLPKVSPALASASNAHPRRTSSRSCSYLACPSASSASACAASSVIVGGGGGE